MCVCPVGVLSVSRCVSPLFQGARKQLQCKRPSRFNVFTAPLYFVLSSPVDTVETVRGTREIAGCSIPGRFTLLSHRVLDGGWDLHLTAQVSLPRRIQHSTSPTCLLGRTDAKPLS